MKKITVDELGKIVTGKTPRTSIIENYGGDIPFLTPTDDLVPMKCYKTINTITEIGLNEVRNCLIPKDSVCVSCIGSDMGHVIMTTKPTVTNQQFNSIMPNEDYPPDYVYYLMILLGKMMKSKFGKSATAVPIVSKSLFSSFEIYVHDNKNEQIVIADVLSKLDQKIAINNRINAELEAMAKQLYDYWFVQFDFPDENGKPYKSSGGKMVYNETLKREIPEGWEVKNIFEVVDVLYGFPFSTDLFTDNKTEKPVVRIRDILDNTTSAYTTENVDEVYKLKEGDLVIGMDGNFHMNYWHNNHCYLNQRCVRFRDKEETPISSIQLYYDIKPVIDNKQKRIQGSTVGHLLDSDIKEFWVLCPQKNKKQYKDAFDSILFKMTTNKIQNQELTHLRDSLLPMLMNGQVTVE